MPYRCEVEEHGEDLSAAVEAARGPGGVIKPAREGEPRRVIVVCSLGHRSVFEVS